MKFLNPAGLWLLLGIPLLILIYLIRSRYEEKTVSGTYLWRLSRRFQKRRLPVQRFRKILLFLLQLLVITGAALAAARPALIQGNCVDYIAILDASASMQMKDEDGVSRFELAQKSISELADETASGHTVSLIVAGENPGYLVQKARSSGEVKLALNRALCENGSCRTHEALELAQLLCDRSENPQVIFYTDTDYVNTDGLRVENLSRGEWNVSATGLTAEFLGEDVSFTATLESRGGDALITCGLKVDGKLMDAKSLEIAADTQGTLEFELPQLGSFETAEVYFEADDGLEADNTYALCREAEKTYRVMLFSSSPLYLKSALEALQNCEVQVAKSCTEETLSGFDLYIFDGVYPDAYPSDGSVLQFGTGRMPDGLTAEGSYSEEALLTVSTSGEHPILTGFVPRETAVTRFAPLKGKSGWKTLLYCGDRGVLATKEGSFGITTTVVSFDLHHSNLPLQEGFVVLMKNLVSYSVPGLLKSTDHIAGSAVQLTLPREAEALYVEKPDGTVEDLPLIGSNVTVAADRVGIYTAAVKSQDGGEYAHFFAHISPKEITSEISDEVLSLEPGFYSETKLRESTRGIWLWVALAMLILALTEWGWYYREQH